MDNQKILIAVFITLAVCLSVVVLSRRMRKCNCKEKYVNKEKYTNEENIGLDKGTLIGNLIWSSKESHPLRKGSGRNIYTIPCTTISWDGGNCNTGKEHHPSVPVNFGLYDPGCIDPYGDLDFSKYAKGESPTISLS